MLLVTITLLGLPERATRIRAGVYLAL